MNIYEEIPALAVKHVLAIQDAAELLGLKVVFIERRPQRAMVGAGASPLLACVISKSNATSENDEHVFFSFDEARAFLRGLEAAKHFMKE